MKIKRISFIISLLVLFGVCFTIMNRHYDELARYPYVTNENRNILLKHLSNEDINYMISQQLKPEQFLPFIETEGFTIRNAHWYTRAKEIQDDSNEVIVSFINDFRPRLDYAHLDTLLQSYSYATLRTFYEEDHRFVANALIKSDPSARLALIDAHETLYRYEPKDLVVIEELPQVSLVEGKSEVLIRKEVLDPLYALCADISEVNDKTCGNMILVAGYISYEDQQPLYESMMLKYGKDEFRRYWDYPGQSEFQLGYTVRFQPAGQEETRLDDTQVVAEALTKEQAQQSEEERLAAWLKEHAHEYGFVVRYPAEKEEKTGKVYQPFTLRYVTKEVASQLYEKQLILEEYKIEIE